MDTNGDEIQEILDDITDTINPSTSNTIPPEDFKNGDTVEKIESSSESEEFSENDEVDYTKCIFCGGKSHKNEDCKYKDMTDPAFSFDDIKVYLCKICSQTFQHIAGLVRHEKRHKQPGGFICKFCNQRFTTDFERNKHKDDKHKFYKCQICDDFFTTDYDYIEHIQTEHNNQDREATPCTVCGQQFKSAAQLKIHMDSKCGTEKTFECQQCSSKFLTQATLNAHLLIHKGEKKHLCNFCGASFLSKGQLKVHERSHTGEKPFECEICGKKFAYRESLVTHSTLHTNIKPYMCESCHSRFSCVGNLIKHRKSRPETCGQPQFQNNTKAAPRATSANFNKNTTIKLPAVYLPKISRGPYNKGSEIETASGLRINKVEAVADDLKQLPEQMVQTIEDDQNEQPNKVLHFDYLMDEEKGGATIFKQEKIEQPEDTMSQYIRDSFSWQDQPSFSESSVIPGLKIELVERQDEDDNDFDCGIPISDADDDDEPLAKYKKKSSSTRIHKKKSSSKLKKEKFMSNVEASVTIKKIDKGDSGKKRLRSQPTQRARLPSISSDSSDSDYRYSGASSKDTLLEQQERLKEAHKVLEQHFMKLETDVETYECKQCPKRYTTKPFMLKHLKEAHNIQLNIELPSNRQTTSNHINRDRRYNCQYCDRSYIGLTSLTKHTSLHGPNGELTHKCTCCTKFFATEEDQEKHQLAEHLAKLECQYCQKRFKDPEATSAHIRHSHNDQKGSKKGYFMCNMCGKNFNSRTAVSDHERSNCGQNPLYKCDVCGKHYHSAGSLKTHRSLHDESMPFICKYCGKRYRTQGQVKVHERCHTGEKPYKCNFENCDKSFSHRETLLTHKSGHTGIKRFMCIGCGQRFSCISNLQAHRKSHKNTCGLLPNMTKAVNAMGIPTETKMYD